MVHLLADGIQEPAASTMSALPLRALAVILVTATWLQSPQASCLHSRWEEVERA